MDNTALKGVAWLMKIKELYNIQQQRKVLERQEKELTEEVKKLCDNQEYSYGGMRYYYEVRKGTVDYMAIPELKDIDLEKYRKPESKVWKIAIEQV